MNNIILNPDHIEESKILRYPFTIENIKKQLRIYHNQDDIKLKDIIEYIIDLYESHFKQNILQREESFFFNIDHNIIEDINNKKFNLDISYKNIIYNYDQLELNKNIDDICFNILSNNTFKNIFILKDNSQIPINLNKIFIKDSKLYFKDKIDKTMQIKIILISNIPTKIDYYLNTKFIKLIHYIYDSNELKIYELLKKICDTKKIQI